MKTYLFYEPHGTGGNALVEITEKQIRDWMNLTYPDVKQEHQIEEFCILHWAWENTSKWYNCPHCDAGYPDQECICEEIEE